jgi:hypothetical protein
MRERRGNVEKVNVAEKFDLFSGYVFGATRRIRTDDLLITNSHAERNNSIDQHVSATKTGSSKG